MKLQPLFFLTIALLLTICISGAQESKTARHAVNLPRGQAASFPFSDAIMAGNTLYISGRLGIDLNTMKVPADIKEEVKLLLDGFKAVLGRGDMTMDDLVTVTVYCPDLSLYPTFNDMYRTYFKGDFPARAFIGSGPLLFGAHFEMQGIAVK